ncbi:MAG: type II toxin-antitoxin system VapC family toxin [Acidimicrobiales bacterium]
MDASALIEAVAAAAVNQRLNARLLDDTSLHAPHLVDVEVLNGLRRLESRGEVTPESAADARRQLSRMTIERYPHGGLADRMWELRKNVSAYDASYIALSEFLRAPLVTCDGKLARAPGHRAMVEHFPRS